MPCDECKAARNLARSGRSRAGYTARRNAQLWTYYRLRWADYQALLVHQGGVCAICRKPPKSHALHVDHDHRCSHAGKGKSSCPECVRGLLCYGCNTHIAILDNAPWLAQARKYLRTGQAGAAQVILASKKRYWQPTLLDLMDQGG